MSDHLPRIPIAVLGLLSIVAFGSWFYGYGVLVEPIAQDTGWSATVLGGTYGASLLATGILGALVGRALDNVGSRRTFLLLAAGSGGFLWLASTATSAALFAGAATLGGGCVGAGGYYTATTAVLARLVPDQRAKAITALTLFGAFASPVALPAIAWLVTDLGWRPTLRILAVAIALSYLAAATAVPDVRPDAAEPLRLRAAAKTAFESLVKRRTIAAVSVMAAATSVLLVQQVPVMVEAGMVLSTASAYAGARGFLQLGGRVPLPAVIRRFGSRRTLQGSYALTAIAAVILVGAGSPLRAGAYALVAGLSIGALAAIEGIYAAEVFDGPTLGTSLGIMSLLRGVGAAIGPTVGGVLIDVFDRQTAALILAITAATLATLLVPQRGASSS